MTNYVLVYSGGGMPETEAEQNAVMAAWGAWYEGLGQAVVDGGNPFGPSVSVASDGSVSQGAPSARSGYTVITVDSPGCGYGTRQVLPDPRQWRPGRRL